MKILIVSLLRLGDIIQQIPLIKGLQEQFPDAEIHLLANKQFKQVEKILDGVVHRYIYFDREAVQKGLGDPAYNILWSYSEVENLIEELNESSYDIVFNFTHNKLSAYLIGALSIPDKRGLFAVEGRFEGLSNRWIRYFNDRFSGIQKSLFNYVEILGKGFGIPVKPNSNSLCEKRGNKLILLQCLTSDEKKNWGLSKYLELKTAFETALVDYDVLVLGAPFERETLLKVFSESDLLICDLIEARKHLLNSDLLITGDTSIKHLAAQVGTPIVEIAVGSSDSIKTSAYTTQAVILKSTIPCAPCIHSQACPQKSHLCADDITVHNVFSAAWDLLTGEKIKQKNLFLQLEKAVWEIYLDQNANCDEFFYHQYIDDFSENISSPAFAEALHSWSSQTSLYRTWHDKIASVLPSREKFLLFKAFTASDLADVILVAQEILKAKCDSAGYFQSFLDALSSRYEQPVQIHEKISKALLEIKELLEVRENLNSICQLHSKEGAHYAKGIRQLSNRSFEEARKSTRRDFENAKL
ncbi:MAG: glycosyltransferase family 9 protein [Pseudobdellovibrionaceae bacterium]